MRSFLCLLFILCFSGNIYSQAVRRDTIKVIKKTSVYVSPACQASTNVLAYKDELYDHPDDYFIGNSYNSNQCIRLLLNAIGFYATMIKDSGAYLMLLDRICSTADDSVSKYLLDVGRVQFYKNFDHMFVYCYTHKHSCFEKRMIQGLILEITSSKDPVMQKKKIDQFILFKIKQLQLGERETNYLNEIRKTLNNCVPG